MLFNLARPLFEHHALANLLISITFRSGCACITSLAMSHATGAMRAYHGQTVSCEWQS